MLVPLLFLVTLLSGSSEVGGIRNVDVLFVLIPRYILATYNVILLLSIKLLMCALKMI